MNVVAFHYTCGVCQTQFEGPGVPDMSYGQFVLRGVNTDVAAYLEATADPVFNEVIKLVEDNPIVKNLPKSRTVDFVQSLFSITCDPSENGDKLEMNRSPLCPNCGSRKMKEWDVIMPPRGWKLPFVQHQNWLALSEEDRRAKIASGVERLAAEPEPIKPLFIPPTLPPPKRSRFRL